MTDKMIVRIVHGLAAAWIVYGVSVVLAVLYGIWFDWPEGVGDKLFNTAALIFWVAGITTAAGAYPASKYPEARKRLDGGGER